MTKRRMASGAFKAAGLMVLTAAIGGTAQAGSGAPTPVGTRPPSDWPTPPQVPEIDPGSALSAFTLLAGGLIVATERRRAKKSF